MAGSISCYGRNLNGQLGNSTKTDSLSPVDVVGFEPGSDDDGDGIANGIDGTFNGGFTDESNNPSSNFTDQHLGGTSFGSFIDLSDLDITVTDAPDPGKLRVEAGGGGVGTASLNLCNFLVLFTDGRVVVFNCASLTMEVVTGPVEVELSENENTLVTVPDGATVKITETAGQFQIENLSDTESITVTTGGQVSELAPGQVIEIETCENLGGDTDGDTLCDDEDPCKSFPNTLPLVTSNFSGIPDECLCGDFDGNGSLSATDAAAVNACAAFVRSDCVSERDEVSPPINGFYSATDASLINRVAAFVDPAYTLICGRRPEGTCGGLTGVSCDF